MNIRQSVIILLNSIFLLSGCVVVPKHLDDLEQDTGVRFSRQTEYDEQIQYSRIAIYSKKSIANQTPYQQETSTYDSVTALSEQVFVPGDVLRINVEGMAQLDGLYQITRQGFIDLPYSVLIRAAGQTRATLLKTLIRVLVNRRWLYEDHINIDLSLVRLAPINVAVTGAVFNGGRISLNNQPNAKPEDRIQHRSGAFSSSRDLVSALQAAGGIRPDADLNNIFIKRGTIITRVPLEGLLNGRGFIETPSLINGDEILVASTNAENAKLIKPSQITPPGMRILLSNLTAPAFNNAQSAVGADSTRLPYGSSLLDSAISANCIGGTQSANASRSVILITRNYGSKRQLVVKRSINQLLANSSDDKVNPYLMPNDGVACYDSRFTNFRDVARGVGELVGPFILGGLL